MIVENDAMGPSQERGGPVTFAGDAMDLLMGLQVRAPDQQLTTDN